ncbi:hypothetical protein [Persicitalea jodogahamensis]|uniref:hypothetical protein n=1 Tax=Persicitalea jodogahamensis TaxID=402147 RepID=UPI00167C26C6|nr:hypothetical protein [Persicitalea jodogahamensis]
MEERKRSKFRRAAYRFWVEYHQYFEGASTRRMRRRAKARRLLSDNFDSLGIFKRMQLAGIY